MDDPLVARANLGEGGTVRGLPKPLNSSIPPRGEVHDLSPLACPALNSKVSAPPLPMSTSIPAPPFSVLSPALP